MCSLRWVGDLRVVLGVMAPRGGLDWWIPSEWQGVWLVGGCYLMSVDWASWNWTARPYWGETRRVPWPRAWRLWAMNWALTWFCPEVPAYSAWANGVKNTPSRARAACPAHRCVVGESPHRARSSKLPWLGAIQVRAPSPPAISMWLSLLA